MSPPANYAFLGRYVPIDAFSIATGGSGPQGGTATGFDTLDNANVVIEFAIAPAPPPLGPMQGGASLAFGATGTLSADAALAGTTSLALATTGTLTGTVVPEGALQGSASLALGVSGSISADAPLAGNASLAFGTAGTLSGNDVRPLQGSAGMQFGASGTLTGTAIGVLRGATSMAFGLTATLTLHQPSKFYGLFADVYLKRQALLNAILTAARILATEPKDVPAEVQAQIDAAEAAAEAANAELATIASDGILSPVEKPTVIRDNNVIIIERAGIDLQAAAFGVVAEKNTYDNAVTALSSYLATLTNPVAWNDLSGDTTIDGPTFRQKFADVYTSRQACLNAIYASAKVRADSAQSTADVAQSLASQVNVLNPGFDAGDTGWDKESGWTIRMDNQSPGVGPGYAQHAGGNATAALRNQARCYVVQGQSYRAQALIQAIGANGQCFARISWRNSNDVEIGLTLGNAITGTTVNGSYATGKPPVGAIYAHAEVATSAHTSGTYKVDNVVSTLTGATWGESLDGIPTELTDGRINNALNSNGDVRFNTNIASGSMGVSTPIDNVRNLTIASSGQRLGDARNQAMVTVGNFGSAWSGMGVTYSSTSTSAMITTASAVMTMGSASVAYNGSSVTVSGAAGTTRLYYLYYNDPTYSGGSRSLVATTSYINSINDDGRVWVGSVSVTYPASGTGGGTGGGGTGGGGGDWACPLREAWVIKRGADGYREFVRAGSIVIGDYLALVSGDWGLVSYSMPAMVPCVRLGIGGGGSPYTLSCSTTAPIGLTDGGQVLAPDALGAEVRVLQSYPRVDTHVTDVQDIGTRWVQHITCENTFYWVGDTANCLYSHHNAKMVP